MNDTAPNVIVIPAKVETPQEQEKKRHLRVAAYCRVSTDSEEQLSSYENQLAYYTEKIMKEPGWTMAGVFADEGITGTSTCKRKEFLRMIRQCRQGKIDMILAKSVSRFARNTVDTLNFTRELRGLGIPVIFEEQNINSIYPESEFLITLHGAFAQAESESTSSRVRWGKRQAMKSGHVTMQYKQLLGYEKGPDGKPGIVPEQAETSASSTTATWPGTPSGRSRRPWKHREPHGLREEDVDGLPYPEHPDQREILRGRPAPEDLHPGLHQQEGDPQHRPAPQIPDSEPP